MRLVCLDIPVQGSNMGNKLSYPQNEIPADRTFIVTGGNTGIGYQTAKCIAKLGGRVIIACRSEERANEALERMQKEHQEEVKQEIQERDDVAKQTKPATKDAEGASADAEGKPSSEITDAKEDKEPSSETTATDAKEEKEPSSETNATDAKEEKEPSSETTATDAKEEKDPSSETTATDTKEEKEPAASTEDPAPPPKEDDQEIQPLKVEFMKLDLSSLASTMEFINAYKAKGYALHVLICNAGLGRVPFQKTDDGFELQFEVNYLSHFLMTLHLLPLLRESAPNSRIINVTSRVHSSGTFDLKNIQGEVSYDRRKFYSNSKVFQIMNMYALTRRLKGAGISVFSVHPGYVDSEFSRGSGDSKLYSFFSTVTKTLHVKRSVEDGAMTSLVAALDNSYDGKSGLYFKDCKIANPSALARDIQKQEQLWEYSLDCLKNYVTKDLLKDLQLPEPLASELKPAEVAADAKTGDGAEAKPEGAESKSEEGTNKSEEAAAEPKGDEGAKSKPEEGTESKPEEGGESKPEEKVESKPEEGTESKPAEEAESQPKETVESKSEEEAKTTPEEGNESKPAEEGSESKPEEGDESKPEEGGESKPEEGGESKPEEEVKRDDEAVNSNGPEDGEGE